MIVLETMLSGGADIVLHTCIFVASASDLTLLDLILFCQLAIERRHYFLQDITSRDQTTIMSFMKSTQSYEN